MRPPAAMPPFRGWADLPSDLLCRIGDSLDLKCYASSRGACTAWRCALAPLYPSLLLSLGHYATVAVSLPTSRSIMLEPIPTGRECVGSSNGWLALSVTGKQGMFTLFHPVTANKILLPPLTHDRASVFKIVFAPNPAPDDFAAAAICAFDTIAYVTAGAKRWAVLDPVSLEGGDRLTDLVYHENGRVVYCLTHYGDVHVLRLPEPCIRETFMVEVEEDSARPTRPWTPAARYALFRFQRRQAEQHQNMLLRRSFGPHLNAPATVEPLLPYDDLPFDDLAPPYCAISVYTRAKNLVFCQGNMYQVWRNTCGLVDMQLPGGGHRILAANEVFVLRYYPQRQPCWDAVNHLGGYSVFVGMNNAVSMYAQGIMGLKGNSVYWTNGNVRDHAMVFDMATKTSTRCLPAASHISVCWYFFGDMINNRNNNN